MRVRVRDFKLMAEVTQWLDIMRSFQVAEVIRERTPPSVERSADVHAVRNVGQGFERRRYRWNNGATVAAVVEQGLDALLAGQGTPSAPWPVAAE